MSQGEIGDNLVGAITKSANSSESIRFNTEVLNEEVDTDLSADTSTSKTTGKYLRDEKLREEVKAILSNYIGKNSIEDLRIRVRDDEAKGYSVRVKIQGDEEMKVSEFLNGSFCKDKKISRLALMTDKGHNGLSCDVNATGIRGYKVQNGPPVIMTVNWYTGEKKCTIEIKLGVNNWKIINRNGVTKEELNANKEIKIIGKSLSFDKTPEEI